MIKTFILAVQTAPTNNAGMNLWDMVVMGGWLMIPIFILSVIIIYIACERFWLIRKTGLTDVPFMEKIQETLKTGNTRVALEECEKEGSPLAHTIAKGIKISNEDPQEIRQAMEDTANYEVANLERGLPTLATCAGTAPMIGFLGTVVGMVQSFYDMSMAGNSIDIGLLSRGIYTAMITTVAGLIVGIIGQLAYNFLVARVDKIVFRMEHYSSELIEYLRPKKIIFNYFVMAIKRKSKINPNFNMSSMTDIFFLLLLFFMISSTLINPNALKLLLPKSTNQTSDKPVTVVSIDKNYTFYLNEKVIPFSMLERRLVEELRELEDPCISLQADKSVPLEQIVKVMNIAKDHNYRLILSTEPE